MKWRAVPSLLRVGFAAAVGIVFLGIVAALSLGQAYVLKDRRR